uniref:glutaminase n=1 Tax=Cebus imitator TaxID=2715852 RepID=A0A2K5RY59_CEBIM
MRSVKALQKALSRAGSHCRRGDWGHLSRSPLLGGGVRHHLSEAAAQGRETPHSHQPLHRDHDSSESGMLSRLGDLLFYTIAEGQERIPIHKFTTALKATGLQTSDPRLRDCMNEMHRVVQESSSGGLLDRGLFRKCVSSNIVLLTQAFRKKFVIPDFEEFTGHVDRIFEDAKELTGGKVAAYIPQLAKSNPDLWGVSLCTVDGQRHSVGHTKIPFCLQSCVKPLTYAISIGTLGTDYVHKFVGKEPSGLRYNKLSLNEDGIPHNPMVNAGAIVVSSLIKMDCNKAEKFDFVLQYLNKMAANEYMGFSNATFQSEKETGDRNYAIGYYPKEKKCFPKGVDMMAALDLYFQLVLSAEAVPILLVVPNVMGMMFRNKTVVNLLFAAYSGDVSALRRWGNIPLDDAVQFNHLEVVKLLQDYQDSYTPSETQAEAAAKALSKENLESMV